MAWDLRYTSAESGPTGRSGFQFVATTPGTPADVTRAVTPYMVYRPPPDAPSAPGPAELAAFPVALSCGREGDHVVLARCRYTGRDYSGRYGNFAGHAVVATRHELEGLRPIELWESPVWSEPAGVTPDLVPGAAFDPDSLVSWVAREDAHVRLAALLDAVTAALAGGHGQVVLVAEDAGLIARWIALLSYSLPAELAAELSFTTYTADPESAPQLIVGTVPSAWQGRGFRLDEPHDPAAPRETRPGRFARVVADCWRTGDLDGIDAVGELLIAGSGPPAEEDAPATNPADDTHASDAPAGDGRGGAAGNSGGSPAGEGSPVGRPGSSTSRGGSPPGDGGPSSPCRDDVPSGRGGAAGSRGGLARGRDGSAGGLDASGGGASSRWDAAAALLALCRGDTSVSAAEESAAAALVHRAGAPEWVWPGLSAALPRLGFDLASALADTAPEIAEHCVLLALADPSLRDRLPAFRLRDGLPDRFRAAVAGAGGLGALVDVVCLADQVGGGIEPGEVTAAAAACARRGAGDVAAALRETPGAWRTAMVAGLLAGLEAADTATRRAMLTAGACTALGDHDWTRAPRTGGLILSARADRHEATAGLVELAAYGLPDIEELLAALWDAPPTPEDCARLVARLGPAMARYATLRRIPHRVFETAPLDAEETVRLAELIRDKLPELAGPALIVLGHGEALRAPGEHEVAHVLGRMDDRDPLTERVRESVAGALAGRSARSRAKILTAASAGVRVGLAAHWLDTATDREGRVDLAEIEVRLHRAHTPVSRLTEWNDALGRFARRHVESGLTDRDPGLALAWRALRRRGT